MIDIAKEQKGKSNQDKIQLNQFKMKLRGDAVLRLIKNLPRFER